MSTEKILIAEMDNTPPQICFANFADDFNPAAANDLRHGTDTEVEMVMLNLLSAAALQTSQFDLGAVRAELYALDAAIEAQVAAFTDGGVFDFYINASHSATAGTANMGAATGVAGAYTGYSADLATALKSFIPVGSLSVTDDTVDQVFIGAGGLYFPRHRYGSLIVVNSAGQTACDTDDIEAHITLSPIVRQIQAAV